jgi:AcrR family transcriptional regulator
MHMANNAAIKPVLLNAIPSTDESSGTALRRNTEKGNSTATAILEQTKNILSDEGLAAISIRSVAERCQMSPGNVTYYFRTKEILFAELAKYLFARWNRRFYQKIPDFASPLDTFMFSIEYMIEENKRPKSSNMLLEMWAMSNHSPAVMTMMDVFYGQMRSWIESLLQAANPLQSKATRQWRAALITAQIEGLMILIGHNRVDHPELRGLEREAIAQIKRLALSD